MPNDAQTVCCLLERKLLSKRQQRVPHPRYILNVLERLRGSLRVERDSGNFDPFYADNGNWPKLAFDKLFHIVQRWRSNALLRLNINKNL